jgi:hypothetical protein
MTREGYRVTLFRCRGAHGSGWRWCIAKSKDDIQYATDVYPTAWAAMVGLADALGL